MLQKVHVGQGQFFPGTEYFLIKDNNFFSASLRNSARARSALSDKTNQIARSLETTSACLTCPIDFFAGSESFFSKQIVFSEKNNWRREFARQLQRQPSRRQGRTVTQKEQRRRSNEANV